MKGIAFILAGVLLAVPVSSIDLAYVAGSTGTDVVLRCIRLLEDSGIFTDDNDIIRRFAYVETRDGETYTAGSGGIWKISSLVLSESLNTSSLFPAIQSHFNIAWGSVTYADLNIPIYSALAARLRLVVFESNSGVTPPTDISIQYDVWFNEFHAEVAILTLSEFTTLVNELPDVLLCAAVYRNIILLVDSTSNITDAEYDMIKTFLLNVVDHFNITSSFTRVGIITFATEQTVVLSLNDGISLSLVQSRINETTKHRSEILRTGTAIQSAIDMFNELENRNTNDGFARVVLLVTHKDSDDVLTSQLQAAESDGVRIIAVGITSAVSESQLNLLTGNSSTNIVSVNAFTDLNGVADTVQQRVCEEQVSISSEKAISATLEPGEQITFAMVFGTGVVRTLSLEATNFTLTATNGGVSSYYSGTVQNPSAVVNDFSVTAVGNGMPVVHTYTPVSSAPTLYCTLESTSNVASLVRFAVGNPIETTTMMGNTNTTEDGTTIAANVVVQAASSNGLSDGEIAGIVLACLTLLAGFIIAVTYYWFCRTKPQEQESSTGLIDLSYPKPLTSEVNLNQNFITEPEKIDKVPTPTPTPPIPTPVPVAIEEPVHESVTSSPVVIAVESKETTDFCTNSDVHSDTNTLTPSQSNSSLNSISIHSSLYKLNEEEVRIQLREAIDNRNFEVVQSSIQEFHRLNLVDVDGDLIRGERLLGLQECMQGLSHAIATRDVKTLEEAIFLAKQKNYGHEVKTEVAKAEILVKDLKKTEVLMARISNAINENNMNLVQNLIFEVRALTGFDQARIEKMMDMHRLKEDMNMAMLNRDIQEAKKTLQNIKEKGFESDLKNEVRSGKKMIKDLEYLEKVRSDVMHLSLTQISEIRSYSNPPHGVHEIMTGVYHLLGFRLEELTNWTNVKALMGRTGKDGLKYQIEHVDPRNIQKSQADEVKTLITSLSLADVKEISTGLALFYVFISSFVEEVENILNRGSVPSPFNFAN